MTLLDIRNLSIELDTPHGRVKALEKVSLTLNAGEVHGLLGESGSGRSLLARTIMGIPGHNWSITVDRMMWDGQNLLELDTKARRALMGSDMAMIFQDPSGSLDPARTVGSQVIEAMPKNPELKFWQQKKYRTQIAQQWLHKVGIKSPDNLMDAYPWELSEGECQKVMIAIALANKPRLLIADEPTTSMELSTQAQIFRLLAKLNLVHGVSILLISHEIETLTHWCDRLTVFYSGQVMESGATDELVSSPRHPYTRILLECLPDKSSPIAHKAFMPSLHGSAPALQHLPIGCRLGPRCPSARKQCVTQPRLVHEKGRYCACHFPIQYDESRHEPTTS
ncbi:MAG: ATP-binding cassette domain-containing protein [Shewanella sp.]|nr:ATP-binding cassette domain-containing protein [Shewanella sp.]MCF1429803.1 ATP-binding cassette domain-containing protein [Shewanella sp.]MCF1438179.1 ATP-binding cassette domain-containing protein [Shewanella sp.]MCF1456801.1 ATP-binding cassette domain-containing protein [Shewanella sp.]